MGFFELKIIKTVRYFGIFRLFPLIMFVLLVEPCYSQFRYYDSGERAVYGEQIWKLNTTSPIDINSKEAYLQAQEWINENIESKQIEVTNEIGGQLIRFKTYHDLTYLITKERVGTYPIYCQFEISIKDSLRLSVISIIFKEQDTLDYRKIHDVSLLEIRPYRTIGKRSRKTDKYTQMLRIEKYLYDLHADISKYIQL